MPVLGWFDSNTDRPFSGLVPQGFPVRSDPHSDRPDTCLSLDLSIIRERPAARLRLEGAAVTQEGHDHPVPLLSCPCTGRAVVGRVVLGRVPELDRVLDLEAHTLGHVERHRDASQDAAIRTNGQIVFGHRDPIFNDLRNTRGGRSYQIAWGLPVSIALIRRISLLGVLGAPEALWWRIHEEPDARIVEW